MLNWNGIRRTLALLSAGPVAMTREHRSGHVTASTMVVDAAGSRVLLCLHGRMNRWVQLGGHCEPGDNSLLEAAVREAWEEREDIAAYAATVADISQHID